MEGWRWKKSTPLYGPGRQKTSPSSRKPTRPRYVWEPTVPSWEKDFVESVGHIPWSKFKEMKRDAYMYKNVLQWDDSAGKEAFDNAKRRFWLEINDKPCEIPLPDPDMHIDNVDTDAAGVFSRAQYGRHGKTPFVDKNYLRENNEGRPYTNPQGSKWFIW